MRHRKQDHVSKMNVSKITESFICHLNRYIWCYSSQPRLICVFRIRLGFEMIILTVIHDHRSRLATRSWILFEVQSMSNFEPKNFSELICIHRLLPIVDPNCARILFYLRPSFVITELHNQD